MQIHVSVQLDSAEAFAHSPDVAAARVLTALGGDATKDACYLTLQRNTSGQAGVEPPAQGGAA